MCLLLIAGTSGAEDLRLKWEEGKRYTFGVSSSNAMTMAFGGNAIASQTDMDQRLHYEVAAHEKGAEVTMGIDSMKMSMRMNGQAMMDYDSEKDPGGGVLGASLKPLFELKVRTVYDKQGKIVEIGGLDDLAGLEQVGMGKEQLEMMVREASAMLPGKDVKPGETWKATMDLPLAPLSEKPAVMDFDLKFEGMVEKGGKALAHITLGGKVSMDAEEGAEAPLQMQSKSVKGEIYFDVELGQPRESRMEMELEMGVPANIPLAEGAPGKMPMSILTTQKLLSVGNAKKEE